MTYAAHNFGWRRPETLADMQANRRRYLDHAAEADRNGEPGIALMWERMADDEDTRMAMHLSEVAHHAAARIEHDRLDVPDGTAPPAWLKWAFGGAMIFAAITMGIPAVCLAWVWLGGLLA